MIQVTLTQVFEILLNELGPQGWWPAQSKTEIILGAFLVQNTNWRNVEYSLLNLEAISQFDPHIIHTLTSEELKILIRPSGFPKNKSRAIREFFEWASHYHFDYLEIKEVYGVSLRQKLLTMHGIGEETADALLLYVFDETVFIADRYAQRLFSKLSGEVFSTYRKLKNNLSLPVDFTLEQAQEFHGLIVEFGKIYLSKNTDYNESFMAPYHFIFG